MRRWWLLCVALAVSGFATGRASAQMTGNDLWLDCQQQNNTFCIAYVRGVLDGIEFISVEKNRDKTFAEFREFRNVCLPDKASAGQVADVVAKFLRENPERRAIPAYFVVVIAIRGAFPCGR